MRYVVPVVLLASLMVQAAEVYVTETSYVTVSRTKLPDGSITEIILGWPEPIPVDVQLQSQPDQEPVSGPFQRPEPQPQPEPQSGYQPVPQAQQEPEPQPEPQSGYQPVPQAQQEPEPQPEYQPVPQAQQEPEPQPEYQPVPQAQQEPEPQPEYQPVPQAQQEPRTQANGVKPSQFVDEILDAHNSKRAKHRAAPLQWSQELANYAESYAAAYSCGSGLVHTGGPYGENLASGVSSCSQGVQLWYDEVNGYDYNSQHLNHFTQVVWKSTHEVGCAVKDCGGNGLYLICEYNKPGNIVGDKYFRENVFPPY